jgi:hypothetical protein
MEMDTSTLVPVSAELIRQLGDSRPHVRMMALSLLTPILDANPARMPEPEAP